MQNYDSLSDPEIMRLVKQGRQEAFVTLVRRHQNSLLNFFRAMGVHTDTEDMVQDTFVRLFKYRRRYKPTAKFTTFLYLLARQVRIDALRKEKRRDNLTQGFTRESAVREHVPAVPRTPEFDIEAALNSLSDGMRAVVVLNIYQGLNYEEVAKTLDIPLGTVKSRMFQALHKMREFLHANK